MNIKENKDLVTNEQINEVLGNTSEEEISKWARKEYRGKPWMSMETAAYWIYWKVIEYYDLDKYDWKLLRKAALKWLKSDDSKKWFNIEQENCINNADKRFVRIKVTYRGGE